MSKAQDFDKLFKDYEGSFDEPVSKVLWASFGDWKLVGNGEVTSDKCGKFSGFKGCVRTDLHDLVTLDGVSFKGKVHVCLKHRSCFNFRCPTCYLAWANREAGRIDGKLGVLSRKYGEVQHLSLSVPEKDYFSIEKDFDKFLVKVRKALRLRFVFGGYLIFHGFRYADFVEAREKGVPFGWRWSPHFHVIGFVRKREFFVAVPKLFLKDGFVVKLLDKRKTVFGTAWYQLNHASYLVSVKKFNVSRGFGCVKTERVDVPERVELCPVCQHELVKLRYFGFDNSIKKDAKDCCHGDRRFFADWLDKDGCLLWDEDTRVNRFGK